MKLGSAASWPLMPTQNPTTKLCVDGVYIFLAFLKLVGKHLWTYFNSSLSEFDF